MLIVPTTCTVYLLREVFGRSGIFHERLYSSANRHPIHRERYPLFYIVHPHSRVPVLVSASLYSRGEDELFPHSPLRDWT